MQKIGYYRKSGELFLQNLSLKKLADHYGTPTFVYDSNLINYQLQIINNLKNELKKNNFYKLISLELNHHQLLNFDQ